MPGSFVLLAAFALAGVAAASAPSGAEISRPGPAPHCAFAGRHESCDVADDRCSGGTMLLQVNAKHGKLSQFDAEKLEGVEEVPRDSPLATILKRAQDLSYNSGEPLEFLLDVDYLHDANNPLDNNGKESRKRPKDPEKEKVPIEADPNLAPSQANNPLDNNGKESQKRPNHPEKEKVPIEADPNLAPSQDGEETLQPTSRHKDKGVRFLHCVTVADPRVTNTSFLSAAPPETPCMFGLDERDEGSHCVFQDGAYGSYGWCYTAEDLSAWGSCSKACPLAGSHATLERRVDGMNKLLDGLLSKAKNITDCDKTRKKSGLSLLEKLRKASSP